MAKMIIYHGSNISVEQPQIRKGKNTKDFGTGFYCTLIREQAIRWAKRFDEPKVSHYNFLPNNKLKFLEFTSMTDEWLDFIIKSRSGEVHTYDIVIGAMANDQVYNYVNDYIDGVITREQFWVLAKFKYPTHQIAFCTKQSLNCLRFLKTEEIL